MWEALLLLLTREGRLQLGDQLRGIRESSASCSSIEYWNWGGLVANEGKGHSTDGTELAPEDDAVFRGDLKGPRPGLALSVAEYFYFGEGALDRGRTSPKLGTVPCARDDGQSMNKTKTLSRA